MKRNAEALMEKWINEQPDKFCLLTGIRGVGKTWLACQFAHSYGSRYVYFDFENDGALRARADRAADLSSFLCSEMGLDNIPDGFVFILDEITYCTGFISLLNKPYGNIPKGAYIMIAGIRASQCLTGTSFYSEAYRIKLDTMSFDEYLMASGKQWYKEVIEGHYESMKKVPGIVHEELMTLFDEYLHVGGFPAVIREYLDGDSGENYLRITGSVRNDLIEDICLIDDSDGACKRKQLFTSVPEQFYKGNRRFMFGDIRRGVTAAYFASALDSLVSDGLIKCLGRYSDTETNKSLMKLYIPDSGLLYHEVRRLGMNDAQKLFKMLVDTYIVNEIRTEECDLCFWDPNGASGLEHVIRKGTDVIPVEVRYSNSSRTKGLASFINYHGQCDHKIVISEVGFGRTDGIEYIPFYGVFCLNK